MNLDLKKTLGNTLLAVLVLLLLSRGISLTGETQPTPISAVESESMEPTFSRGDLVFWRPVSIDDIDVGDIVIYSSEAREGELVIHRVVEIRETSTGKELITQGDANNYTDQSGPHYPEPPVTEDNLLGTPVSMGGWAFRIPQVGNIWLWTSALFAGAVTRGLAGGGLAMLVPILTAGVMIILTVMFFTTDEEEDDEDSELKRLIMEEEKTHIWQIFLILFIAFSFVVVPSTWYGSNTTDLSIGVEEDAGEGQNAYPYADKGETIEGNQTIENPGYTTLTHYVSIQGERSEWVTVDKKDFRTEPGGNATVNFQVNVPEDAESGTYNEKIVNHYSPFWSVYPQGFASAFIEGSPAHGILMLNLFTAFVFAVATLLLMLVISYAIDEYIIWREYHKTKKAIKMRDDKERVSILDKISSFKNDMKEKTLELFDWVRGVDVIDFEPREPFYASMIGFVAVPLYFLNADLWALIFLVPLSSALAYYLGCRWRAEIFTAALLCSAIVVITLLYLPFAVLYIGNLTVTNLSLLLQSLAVILLIYLILSPFILFLSYITVRLIHRYRLKKLPQVKKELSDI